MANQHYPTEIEAQWLAVSFSSSGDNTIVAGVAGQTIRVISLVLGAATQTNLTLKDGATARSGAIPTTSLVLDLDSKPFICGVGNSFVINSSVATSVGGMVLVVQG